MPVLGEHITGSDLAATAMGCGITLLLRARHAHRHIHEPFTHEHRHRHDDPHHGTVGSTAPPASHSNGCHCTAELPRQGPLMHPELAGHERQGCAFLVSADRQGDGLVGHLAHDAPSSDAGAIEVVLTGLADVDEDPLLDLMDEGAENSSPASS